MPSPLPKPPTADRDPPAACLIVNAQAGLAATRPWRARVLAALAPRFRVELVETADAGAAAAAAETAARAGLPLVVVAGGDGSVNAVLAALGTDAAPDLGVIPLGTANDLARGLGLPLDPEAAADRIAAPSPGGPRRIDLVTVNGRPFCTVGGLGLPATCALALPRARAKGALPAALARALGPRAYHLAALATILGSPTPATAITITYTAPEGGPERTLATRGHGLFVANQPRLGGGLPVSPGSTPDDGVFELCVLGATSRGGLVATLATLAAGRTPPLHRLGALRVRAAQVACETATAFFADGELLCAGRTFVLALKPRALSVIC